MLRWRKKRRGERKEMGYKITVSLCRRTKKKSMRETSESIDEVTTIEWVGRLATSLHIANTGLYF